MTRNVTDSEIAAVTAVVRGLLREESEAAHSTPETGRSAWELSQRALRKPMHPAHGAWRGFPA
ncbi:acyl-CoA carboxylase subunit epsilon [Glaciibacter superstes]|uniref:acyl-CoA carboxylase subunit epsilon n=1 Tax=Glaciibacter superstes TaxID=501023 RepID=UPI00041AFFE0|nr:acyl-CoA carboxylase subunit epsilon [Glaciibacter superstes]